MNRVRSIVLTVSLVLGGLFIIPGTAQAADYSVKMTDACNSTHGAYWYAVHLYSGAYGWRCTYPQPPWEDKVYKGANVQLHCTRYYPGSSAIAKNPSDPNSWVCRV